MEHNDNILSRRTTHERAHDFSEQVFWGTRQHFNWNLQQNDAPAILIIVVEELLKLVKGVSQNNRGEAKQKVMFSGTASERHAQYLH